ncbi:STAS domain-containing protein [Lentzea rhizosphaerae]|uniref:STAS domain-containing protein n=1 Tax=Lentzea rhizosphaerae TaxID=2041025 RepID=A0ABV8C5G9_9PSEU
MNVTVSDRRLLVPLDGEIDLLTAPVLGAGLQRSLEQSPRQLAVDMSRVSLLSAAGITMLLEAKTAADRLGVALILVDCPRHVRRTLRMTDLHEFFELDPVVQPSEEPVGCQNSAHMR